MRAAKAGLLSFFGAEGLPLHTIEGALRQIRQQLSNDHFFGVGMLRSQGDEDSEMRLAHLCVQYKVPALEISSFSMVSRAIVYYRVKGLKKRWDGSIECQHKIIAKVSHIHQVASYLKPPPRWIVDELLSEQLINPEQAEMSQSIGLCDDLCVIGDCGEKTTGGSVFLLYPHVYQIKKQLETSYPHVRNVHLGVGGGLGTPQAIAHVFSMGADFILTGSINQATVEAGSSAAVKELLITMGLMDTQTCSSENVFDTQGRIQVLNMHNAFPAKADFLQALWMSYESVSDMPSSLQVHLKEQYFDDLGDNNNEHSKSTVSNLKGDLDPKLSMAKLFESYFERAQNHVILANDSLDNATDYLIHTGPALGAFNEWVKGTPLESWKNRHVDVVAIHLLESAQQVLNNPRNQR